MDSLFFKEEHIMIQNMVRDFAKSQIAPVARNFDQKCKFPTELIGEMSELGLMGIIVPEEYGGSGLDMVAFATAVIELARADASVAITMAAHSSLGTLPLILLGNGVLVSTVLALEEIEWKTGRMVMSNNLTCLHRRTPNKNVTGKRLLSRAYVHKL